MEPSAVKRRASDLEIAAACFVANVAIDDVLEAWVDEVTHTIDVVLKNIERITVNVTIAA